MITLASNIERKSKSSRKRTTRRFKTSKAKTKGKYTGTFVVNMLASCDIPVVSTVIDTLLTLKDVVEVVSEEGTTKISRKCDKTGIGQHYEAKKTEFESEVKKLVDGSVDRLGLIAQNLDATGDLGVALLTTNNLRAQCKALQKKAGKRVKDAKSAQKKADDDLKKMNKKGDTYIAANYDAFEKASKDLQVANDELKALEDIGSLDGDYDCSKLPDKEINAEAKATFTQKIAAAWSTLGFVKDCIFKALKNNLKMIFKVTLSILKWIVGIVLEILTVGVWKIIKFGWNIIQLLWAVGKAWYTDSEEEKAENWGSAVGICIAIIKDLIPGSGRRRLKKK
jgi:hypothetical protein